MERKTANIILKVFVAIWIVTSITFLLLVLFRTDTWYDQKSTIIQLVIWLLISVALGLYIFCVRPGRRNE